MRRRLNPLRKTSDTVEAWAGLLLGSVLLFAVPPACVMLVQASPGAADEAAGRWGSQGHETRLVTVSTSRPSKR
ncbi:hypothetical protein [Streptomyces sp. NPDC058268]|uniref:hypothetical protein n=1 Tax=Streptomyces sp. NPDC058268 TaxID=3346413 RepID=UPI0036E69A6F